ncbi:unnamed protein product [Closterium sp. NIES-53]
MSGRLPKNGNPQGPGGNFPRSHNTQVEDQIADDSVTAFASPSPAFAPFRLRLEEKRRETAGRSPTRRRRRVGRMESERVRGVGDQGRSM